MPRRIVDISVALKGGIASDPSYMLPTINYLQEQGAKVILCSHLGRPDGKVVESMRLTPVAQRLEELLGQPVKDTLCGTKVLSRAHYERIAAQRAYFGDFDPFGDFDLIFGASKLNLKTIDLPIRYAARSYGETQISRFRHGVMLLKMVDFAFFKIKAI